MLCIEPQTLKNYLINKQNMVHIDLHQFKLNCKIHIVDKYLILLFKYTFTRVFLLNTCYDSLN